MRSRPRVAPSARTASLLAAALATACPPAVDLVPIDQPVFPTGLAVAGDKLLVVSSDFDLAYADGAFLAADRTAVEEAVRAGTGDVVVRGAYSDAVLLPPFGDKPVVSSGAERVYVASRGSNVLSVLDLETQGDGGLSCGAAPLVEELGVQRCGVSPFALQLSDNDPLDVLLLDEERAQDELVRVEGMVTSLDSGRAVFFSDDRRRSGAEQMRIDASLLLGEDVRGIRSMVLRPSVAGSVPVVIAAADLTSQVGSTGTALLIFEPDARTNVERFDVSLATGAFSMRDIVLVPGVDGDADALVAVLRAPDALARFEIDDDGPLPSLRLTAVGSTCRDPTSLAFARIPLAGDAVPVERVLVTCQVGDVIQAVDPRTLEPTDAVRFEGRGPYDVVVASSSDPPVAYVSFFLDNSVGVLDLVDDAGSPRLVFRGRIGEPTSRPEDGRE